MKILKRLFIFISFIFVLGIGALYYWLNTRWKTVFTESEMRSLAAPLNNSPDLPVRFYQIYDQLHPGQRKNSMDDDLFYIIKILLGFSSDYNYISCQCRISYNNIELINETGLTKAERIDNLNNIVFQYLDYFAAWGLVKYSSPEKCFDYNILSFLNDQKRNPLNKALSELSVVPLSQMNDDEILEFYLLMEAPTRYDRYRNPEIVENKLKELKSKILNQ